MKNDENERWKSRKEFIFLMNIRFKYFRKTINWLTWKTCLLIFLIKLGMKICKSKVQNKPNVLVQYKKKLSTHRLKLNDKTFVNFFSKENPIQKVIRIEALRGGRLVGSPHLPSYVTEVIQFLLQTT